jgi:hypothetical protein
MHPYKRVLDLWVSRHFGNERAEYLLRQFGTQVLDVFRGRADPADATQRETLEAAAALDDAKSFFHWELEFPEVYYDLDRTTRKQNPGFDAVIGNPPYVQIQTLRETDEEAVSFFNDTFEAATGNYDIYVLFTEKGGRLLKSKGRLGYILPNKLFRVDYGEGLRGLLSQGGHVAGVVDFGAEQVFPDNATTYTALLFLQGSELSDKFQYLKIEEGQLPSTLGSTDECWKSTTYRNSDLDATSWNFRSPETQELIDAVDSVSSRLGNLTSSIARGVSTGDDDIFVLEVTEEKEDATVCRSDVTDGTVEVENELLRIPIHSTDFGKYEHRDQKGNVLLWPYDETSEHQIRSFSEIKDEFPKAASYLERCRSLLKDRAQYSAWYGYSAPRNLATHDAAEIIIPLLAEEPSFAPYPEPQNAYMLMASGGFSISIRPNSKLDFFYVLSLINTKLLFFYLRSLSNVFRGGYVTCTKQYFRQLPIRKINFTTPEDERERHVEALIRDYKEARRSTPPPADTAVLAAVEEHLSAEPERTDVIHDLLAHLAHEMTQLKEERRDLERAFDPFKYLPRGASATPFSAAFSDEIKYAELAQSPVDPTTAQHSIDDARLVEADGTWVLEVRLKKRQPEDWTEWQKEDGAIVRMWAPVLRFRDLDAEKARFYRFALPRLDAFSDDAFSGTIFPGGYTRTVKARLWNTPVPAYDASIDLDDLVDLERQIQETEQNIAFTDTLIDQIVYRLYGLSEEEINIVEDGR